MIWWIRWKMANEAMRLSIALMPESVGKRMYVDILTGVKTTVIETVEADRREGTDNGQVKAWGVINYAGGLMPLAFMTKTAAEIDRLNRWPGMPGASRVVRVTVIISPEAE